MCEEERSMHMNVLKTLFVTAVVALMLNVPSALAQQPRLQQDDKHPPTSSSTPGMPAAGMEAHMAQHMEMCRQMMGSGGMMSGGMGPGMMGGMAGGGMMDGTMMGADPKQRAEMMAMRGEIMKAMGDIMLKYAQRMQSGK